MKFYLRLSLNIFKQNMAYRFEYITKVVALFLTVFAQYYIWRVLLVYQNNTSDVNITEMTTYIIVSTVIGIVLNNRIISEINDQIYTGKIGTELVKPYSYFSLMLAAKKSTQKRAWTSSCWVHRAKWAIFMVNLRAGTLTTRAGQTIMLATARF